MVLAVLPSSYLKHWVCGVQNPMVIHSSACLPLMSGHVTFWNVGLYCIMGMHDKFNISTNVCIVGFHFKHVFQIKL